MDSLPSKPLYITCILIKKIANMLEVINLYFIIPHFFVYMRSRWSIALAKKLNKPLVNPIQICFVVNFLLIIFIFLLHILFLYILWLESRTLRSWIGHFVLINQKPWIIETISQNQVRKKENSFILSNKSFKNKVQPIFNINAWMYVPMKMYEA